jgi:murein DD-endopeptidase MepM/ murein hydrolase activator NlpD
MSKRFMAAIAVVAVTTAVIYLYLSNGRTNARRVQVFTWFRDPNSHPEVILQAGSRCADAPFLFPTDGVAGFLWDDSFRVGHRHQGIDIFAGTDPGVTRVIAAYPGYVRRLPDWKSSIIVRVPEDPLVPGRQVWLYYTHMADKNGSSYISHEFPPGTSEKWIEAGTFLGYQGDYSGDPFNPVGVHLHFSIVKDDGNGRFKNELEIANTYDPSPYLGLALNANKNRDEIPVCE